MWALGPNEWQEGEGGGDAPVHPDMMSMRGVADSPG